MVVSGNTKLGENVGEVVTMWGKVVISSSNTSDFTSLGPLSQGGTGESVLGGDRAGSDIHVWW